MVSNYPAYVKPQSSCRSVRPASSQSSSVNVRSKPVSPFQYYLSINLQIFQLISSFRFSPVTFCTHISTYCAYCMLPALSPHRTACCLLCHLIILHAACSITSSYCMLPALSPHHTACCLLCHLIILHAACSVISSYCMLPALSPHHTACCLLCHLIIFYYSNKADNALRKT